jgi:hypothetical protein
MAPIMVDLFLRYYRIYGPLLIVATLGYMIIFWSAANWTSLKASYNCLSLKNVIQGNIHKCFSSRVGPTCRHSDIGYIYGWCNDPDNHGPMPGNNMGPYNTYCSQWIWSNEDCPPDHCSGDFPQGLDNQECKLGTQKWGWCADQGVDKAMIGTVCGPVGTRCDKWIWDAKKCPQTCDPLVKQVQQQCHRNSKGQCNHICGKMPDGSDKPCPPPQCGEEGCPDPCVCEGPPEKPWKPYLGRPITLRTYKGDCILQRLDTEKQPYGVADGKKAAVWKCSRKKIDLKELQKQGLSLTMEEVGEDKSTGEKIYHLRDVDGCVLQWSNQPGGAGAGKMEYVAKFDCSGESPNKVLVKGTPDKCELYAHNFKTNDGIKNCGLQWSSAMGAGKGLSKNHRLAKFDCADTTGDKLVVDMFRGT